MKKFYIFIAVVLFSATISAYGQQVILRFSKNYEVSIDGRYYEYNETVPTLNYGQHEIKLYEVEPGFLGLGKRRVLANTSSFELRNNDVIIEVDQNRRLRISQVGNNNNTRNQQDNRNYDRTNDRNGDYNNQQNGKGYGPYNNPGRGHKYCLYKKGNSKKHDKDDDRDEKKKDDKNKKDKKGQNEHDRWHEEHDRYQNNKN